MGDADQVSYDSIQYGSEPFRVSHPDNLAAVATLAGLEPPATTPCRVLELGCASGGNLIPLAYSLPSATLLGVDLSTEQVAAGQEQIEALDLANVELRACSLSDLPKDAGSFDYIIAHGLFSWIPPEVQVDLMELFRRHLAPDGLAYVSYNTNPGWRLRTMVRDMMLFHVGQLDQPEDRIQQGRALVQFLAAAAPRPDEPYARTVKAEAQLLAESPDYYLFHEHLEDENRPLYFHEFIGILGAHALEWVGEAKPTDLKPGELAPDAERALDRIAPAPLLREQYLDFLRGRAFRRSVLSHADRPRDERQPHERAAKLHVSANLVTQEPIVIAGDAPGHFAGPGEARLQTTEPWLKAALLTLSEEFPRALPFPELEQRASDACGSTVPSEHLFAALHSGWLDGVIGFHSSPPPTTRHLTERPMASPLVRLQASGGTRVTNLLHTLVELGSREQSLLSLLDGTRTATDIEKDAQRLGMGTVEEIRDSLSAIGRAGLLLGS